MVWGLDSVQNELGVVKRTGSGPNHPNQEILARTLSLAYETKHIGCLPPSQTPPGRPCYSPPRLSRKALHADG